jgi:peptidoglycan-N-acetylglucosamine deacetylase
MKQQVSDMHFPTVPFAVRLLSPSALNWSIKDPVPKPDRVTGKDINNTKKLYITFDDGPVPEVTPQVLDILKEYDAKATFFCVGDNVRKYPEIYKMVLDDGHATGNHSFSHLNGSKTDNATWYADIEKCSEYVHSSLFRPPHGRITYKQVKYLREKFKIIMWSVLTGDYNHSLSKEMVLDFALKYSKSGSIIVFHDSIKASERLLYALPRVLEHFSKLGFSFEKISID